jgi:hypothetical protein
MSKEYASVAFQMEEGVLHESLGALDFSKFKLEIIPPSSARQDQAQTVPWRRIVKVPKDGVVKLKLLPSKTFFWERDVGRKNYYTIKVFHQNSSIELDTWYWFVPPPRYNRRESLEVKNEKIAIPIHAYEILSVEDIENYEVGKRYIHVPGLEDGEQVFVLYEFAYTLNDITDMPYGGNISADKRQYGYWFSGARFPNPRLY